MATSTAEGLGRALKQPEIDRIEYRLSLNGGTLIEEIAADLVNRFGKSPDLRLKAEALRDRVELLRRNRRMAQAGGNLDEVDRFSKQIEEAEKKGDPAQMLAEAQQLRREEKRDYAASAMEYIRGSYGDAVMMDGVERGYGSDMRVQQILNQFGTPTGHLKKVW